ncbi:phage/plasmid primase, P4 family [Planctopirus hydrillae]|uniref:SF3 helicase domain-containing protein n=1 Tax=Planctopirus hydrillae TaxID=1841610 RepID=A0A1C3ETR2_9PLAN|nr:phage/plasmid primase, P4 family [Planctopirus hydrillae]ODA36727.1 hypothetical protein A6X21_15400 [Planctopirus hydrillae]
MPKPPLSLEDFEQLVHGQNGKARCPAHDDQQSSLTYSRGNKGGIVVKCHAGCEFKAIVAALDLHPSQLMPPQNSRLPGIRKSGSKPSVKQRRGGFAKIETAQQALAEQFQGEKPANHWPYHDAAGNLVGQVARWNTPGGGKEIRPLALIDGRWHVAAMPEPRSLYRLPEVVNAETVWIVEGEKAADALRSLKLVATTSAGGAKAANKSDWGALTGKNVNIWPDHDEPGEKYAADVASYLLALDPPATVRIVRPFSGNPDAAKGDDAFDWIERQRKANPDTMPGDLRKQLETMAETQTAFVATATDGADSTVYDLIRNADQYPGVSAEYGQTHAANGIRFHLRYKEQAMFITQWDKWYVWDGTRWKMDSGNCQVERLAAEMAASLFDEAGAISEAEPDKRAISFAKSSSNSSGINATVRHARGLLSVSFDELDNHPYLLNCSNGIVDLRTGGISPHDRKLLITQLCPIAFRPDATAPRFLRFVEEIFPNHPDVPGYIQRLVGYCLTGDGKEHIFPVWQGEGSNGKSTLAEVLRFTFGDDYSAQIPASTLLVKHGESHPTELTVFHKKRLVIASETPEGATLNESMVKQITGGDTITARRMREDFWEFKPTHKTILLTNPKPRIKGTDNAIWRRVQMIPFTRTFSNEEKDASLPDELKGEAEGILAWAVQGCRDWQEHGLQPPEVICEATQSYRHDENIVGRFIEERCLTGQNVYRVTFANLYEDYRKWASKNGEAEISGKAFSGKLKALGFEPARTREARWYTGLTLKPDYESAFEDDDSESSPVEEFQFS